MEKLGLILIGFVIGVFISSMLIQPYFLPERSNEVLKFINSSHYSLDIVVYSLYESPITDLIFEKANEGVKVRIVVNKDRFDPTVLHKLNNHPNIEVRIAKTTTHAKFYIVDGVKVMVGSNNISKSALKRNVEAGVFILFFNVERFVEEFSVIWNNSTPLQ